MKKKTFIAACLLFMAAVALWTQAPGRAAVKLLITPQVNAGQGFIDFYFQVMDGYHITDLKNNFFSIELEKNDSTVIKRVIFPNGVPYGEEKVFQGKFTVRVYIKTLRAIPEPFTLEFNVSYQICQEVPQELCYPPDRSQVQIGIGPDFSPAATEGADSEPLARRLENLIRGQLKQTSLLLFILVFAAGFLASLTPCVYPVIPIIMGYVGNRSGGRKLKGFSLSLFFVLGLSMVYSLLGVVAAKTGSLIGISFQNPVVVIFIAAIFIIMGLSLAGLFSIPVPSGISSWVSRGHKSEYLGAVIVGGVSAIIAAPCVGPVLIALLSWISQSGNVFLGFWLTFVFSLGMSIIFLLAGTFSGVIASLPRGGGWMNNVKHFFAALLIAGGIFFLSSILPHWLNLMLWGTYLIALALVESVFRPKSKSGFGLVIARAAAFLVILTGATLCYQGFSGRFFPTTSSVPTAENLPWVHDLAQAKEKAKAENKRLLIDAWAEWCAACRELDKKTFSRTDVQESLRDYILVKLDLTRKSESSGQLQKELAIIGMPTIIFLDATGKEMGRFSGFLDGSEFLGLLRGLKNK